LSDPAKWRIVGARAEAWLIALVDAGLAAVERSASVRWKELPGTIVSRADRAVPHRAGAIPLVVGRSRIGQVDDAGVTLGAGDPAVPVDWVPQCGCDACDSGSQDVLDELDDYILGVISGGFRRLWAGDREITVIGGARGRGWRASGRFRRGEVEAILADPAGWRELSGAPWTAGG
jgi:hypothetical protein